MANNVNDLFESLLWKLKVEGVKQNSRNGGVITLEEPTIFHMRRPWQRVLFSERRKCNPYLHVMETVWMLGGGKDVGFLEYYAKNMRSYAEDDGLINGAYGHRWRTHFGRDQIMGIIRELEGNHDSRQAVIAMYDPSIDFQPRWRDRPCNTHIYFRMVDNALNMTVCNRSNDLVWGACGANAVHMTYLHEFIACALKVKLGRYYVMTNNLHIYERHWDLLESPDFGTRDFYSVDWHHEHIFHHEQSPWEFLEECRLYLLHEQEGTYKSPWINRVVIPMADHYNCRKNGDKDTYDINETRDSAWQTAEHLWRSWHP